MEKNKNPPSPCYECKIKCCTKLVVPITIFDAKRIVRITKKRIEDFALLMDYHSVNQNLYDSIFFLNQENKLEEKILVLKRSGKSCIFLEEEKKCRIWGSHPRACRCYPFYDFEEKTKKLKYVKNFLCPRKWTEEEKWSFDFKKSIEDLVKENMQYNKIIREWNALHYKKTKKEFFEWLENYQITLTL
ncbi:MAG: YkgJ family cysteine cluster protein [Candidatus Anstonellaceae archaeon]